MFELLTNKDLMLEWYMLPVDERLIAETVSTDDVARLANGMLARRVNAEWIHHNPKAAEAVILFANAFRSHVEAVTPGAVGCFVLGGGRKLGFAFPGVSLGVAKNGDLVGDLPPYGIVYLIEDVLTTGGSAVRAVDAVRRSGIRVESMFVLIDRGVGAVRDIRRLGVNVVVAAEVRAYNEERFVR
jgi:hypothetical protein